MSEGTHRFPDSTKPGLQKQPLTQDPVQLEELMVGFWQVGTHDGPHSKNSEFGGHFTVWRKWRKIRENLRRTNTYWFLPLILFKTASFIRIEYAPHKAC